MEIKIESSSWIAGALGLSEPGVAGTAAGLDKGTTLQGLLTGLARQHPQFAEQVYDMDNGHLADGLIVVLNQKIVREREFNRTVLYAGDTISFIPIISGG